MCQLPLMSMWVSRTRSPERWMSSHLPRASTFLTVRPLTALSTSTRARSGRTVSNRVTGHPARARSSVLAVRKMVSPSGTSGGLRDVRIAFFVGVFGRRGLGKHVLKWGDTAHLKAERGVQEAGFFEVTRQEVLAGGLVVDFADEQAAAPALAAHGQRGEFLGELAGEAAALGFGLRKKDAHCGVLAAEKTSQLAVDEHHRRSTSTRHAVMLGQALPGRRIRARPGEDAAVGITGVARGQGHRLRRYRLVAEVAQQIDRRGHGELRRS